MEPTRLCDEIRAFCDVLNRGRLTEIDLDALGGCLTETLRVLDAMKHDKFGEDLLKSDVISEIVNLSRAARALEHGESGIDSGDMSSKLESLDAKSLLAIRSRARFRFSKLHRSVGVPQRRSGHTSAQISYADYKIGDMRV